MAPNQLPAITDMPAIGLYMDQLLELLDHYLGTLKRNEQDVVFTKTMVNNYVKAGVITPPIKKKYARESMIELIMVYYFKQVFSINDTASLVGIVMNAHHGNRLAAYETFKNHVIRLTADSSSPLAEVISHDSAPVTESFSQSDLERDALSAKASDTAKNIGIEEIEIDRILHHALTATLQKQSAEHCMDAVLTAKHSN